MSSDLKDIRIKWRGRYTKGTAPPIDSSDPAPTVELPLIETLKKYGIDSSEQAQGYLIQKTGYSDIIIAYNSANKALVDGVIAALRHVVDNADELGLARYLRRDGGLGIPGQENETLIFNFVSKQDKQKEGFYSNLDGPSSYLPFLSAENFGQGLIDAFSGNRASTDQEYDYFQVNTNLQYLKEGVYVDYFPDNIRYNYISTFIHELTHRDNDHLYDKYRFLSPDNIEFFSKKYSVDDDVNSPTYLDTREALTKLYVDGWILDPSFRKFGTADATGEALDEVEFKDRLADIDRSSIGGADFENAVNDIRKALVLEYGSKSGFDGFSVEQLEPDLKLS